MEERIGQRNNDGCDITRSISCSTVVCFVFHDTPPKFPTMVFQEILQQCSFPIMTCKCYSRFVFWQYVNSYILNSDFKYLILERSLT